MSSGVLRASIAALALSLAGCGEPDPDPVPGSIAFSDATELLPRVWPEGLYQERLVPYGPAWLDLNGDGRLDLVFMNHGGHPFLFAGTGDRGFEDLSMYAGLRWDDWEYPQQQDRHGMACGDFDNDGRPDLHIAHGAARGETLGVKRDELLRNLGRVRFADVAERFGAVNARGRARSGSWADVDADGWLDLYVSNYRTENRLYVNRDGASFSDRSGPSGLEIPGPSAGWQDYDLDGDADVLVSYPPRLMRNDGSGRFDDVTGPSGLAAVDIHIPHTVAWADFDLDGDPDVFLGGRESPGRLMVNDDGRFSPFDPDADWGWRAGAVGMGAVWGDLDNDGDPDLVRVFEDGVRVFANVSGRRFVPAELEAPAPSGLRASEAALGDFDGDGRLDLALSTRDGSRLYRNTGGTGAWLKLYFRGTASNRMGFGVRVVATGESADGERVRVTRQYFGDNGVFQSAGCGPLHLGLGDAVSVDLDVSWPSGRSQRIENLAVDRQWMITEPEPAGAVH